MNETIRILIADDHPVTRAGIRTILEEATDIEVVGEAKDGVEAKQMVADLQPDVLLLDLVMPSLRPFEVEKWVRTNYPETVTLILTSHDRDYYLAETIRAGAVGFLTKEEAPQRLLEAVRRAARGDLLITGGQLRRVNHWREEVGERWESLTEREREVLHLLVQGLDNAAIADMLCVSVNTVRSHNSHIYSKLGVADRAEAIAFVLRHKLLGP
jgi:DNA-binding NarL/FixJ family response regulator